MQTIQKDIDQNEEYLKQRKKDLELTFWRSYSHDVNRDGINLSQTC